MNVYIIFLSLILDWDVYDPQEPSEQLQKPDEQLPEPYDSDDYEISNDIDSMDSSVNSQCKLLIITCALMESLYTLTDKAK